MKDNSKKGVKAPKEQQDREKRKRAEEALRQSESMYRALFEAALDGALVVDTELRIVVASEAAAKMYGLESAKDAIGMSPLDFVAPEERVRVVRVITEDLFEKDLRHVDEYRTLTRDGREIWVSATGTRTEYEGKLAGLISLKDITEHKQAEEALRQSEEKFAKAFRSCPDPICITTLNEGRCLDANDSFLHTTGYRPDEVIGRTTVELGLWARPEERGRVIRMVQTKGRVSNLELDFRMKSGQIRTGLVSIESIDIRSEPCLLTVISDITERKQAETKYATIVETALDGFWIIDLKGRFLNVNDSYCQMVGYTREELLTMSISDVEAMERPEETVQRIRKIVEQGYDRFETRHRRKDGQIIELEINVKYSDVEGGQEVVFIRDITERKRAEEALRKAKEFSDSLITLMQDGFSVLDSNGVHIDVNPAFCRMTGFSREELIGAGLPHPYWPPESLEEIERAFQNTSKGEFDNFELTFIRKDGERFPVIVSPSWVKDTQGNVISYFATVKDITERKRAEQELQRKEEHFRSLIENTSDAIAIVNGDGTVRYQSPSYLRMLGYVPEEETGRSIFNNIHPDDIAKVSRAFAALLQDPGGTSTMEVRVRFRDGSWRIIEAVGKNLLHHPAVEGIVVNFRDITESRRAEEALQESEAWFKGIYEDSPIAIELFDSDGRLIGVNKACLNMFGQRDDTKLKWFKLLEDPYLPEDVKQKVRAGQVARYKTRWDFEEVKRLKLYETTRSGVVHLDVMVSPLGLSEGEPLRGYVVRIQDVTERRQAEEALRESEVKYRSLFEEANDAILIADTESEEIIDANREAERLLGLSRKEIIGMNRSRLHPLEKADYYQEHFKKHIGAGHIVDLNAEVVRKDGTIVPVFISANTLQLGGKKLIQGVFRDITERKRAEEALRESEEKYRLLAENVTDLIYVLDMDMKVTYVSPSITRLLGFSVEEGMARGLTESLTPASLEVASKAWQNVLPVGKKRPGGFRDRGAAELEMYRKDGSTVWVESLVTVMQDSGGRPVGIMGVTRNISQRKRAEEALRESEAKYAAVAEQAADGIVVVQDGIIKFANNGHAQITGYSVEELIGMPFLDTADSSTRDLVGQRYAMRMAGTPSSVAFETRILCKDGTVKEAEARSTTIQYQGRPAVLSIVRDVTERKRAEEELQHKEDHFRSLIENASDAITILDGDGTTRYQSPSYGPALGYVPGEEIGSNMLNNIHPDDVTKVSEDFARLLQDPSYTSHFEARIRTRDGSWRVIEGVSRNLLHHPAVAGIVVNFRDVTGRKKAEEELRQAYERETKLRSELEEEMKRRVEFTRAMVHELKTPLTSVIASSELLALELPEGPLLRMVSNISRSADNLNKRIDELFDVARGELGMLRLSLTSVDPLRVLRELADDMGPVALRQHQSLVLDLPPALLPVWADEKRLRQVVLNLLSNACKFTGEGGKITLKAREKGDRLIAEVKDTGPGLSEAEQQRLFTAYYRGEGDRERFSGLGLGLALCKTLVELHKGQIWVRSQPGKGSTFGFSVPLATASQRGEAAEGEEEE